MCPRMSINGSIHPNHMRVKTMIANVAVRDCAEYDMRSYRWLACCVYLENAQFVQVGVHERCAWA